MVVDRFASRHGLTNPKTRFHSAILEGCVASHRCVLIEPMTFMNRSGMAVQQVVQFYKLDAALDLLIVVDDVALPVGQIRLRSEGGSGGHNGLADIERMLGTRAYPRLRIGIDPPGVCPQADYVLTAFSATQLTLLEPTFDRACDAIDCWIRDGITMAMTRHNNPDPK